MGSLPGVEKNPNVGGNKSWRMDTAGVWGKVIIQDHCYWYLNKGHASQTAPGGVVSCTGKCIHVFWAFPEFPKGLVKFDRELKRWGAETGRESTSQGGGSEKENERGGMITRSLPSEF